MTIYHSTSAGDFIGYAACSALFKNESTIRLSQCHNSCGTGYQPYGKWDAIGAVLNWVVPLFALVGNTHFPHLVAPLPSVAKPSPWAALGMRLLQIVINYTFTFAHLLGNPVDAIASLLEKLGHARRIEIHVRKKVDLRKRVAGLGQTESEELTRDLVSVLLAFDDFESSFDATGCLFTNGSPGSALLGRILVKQARRGDGYGELRTALSQAGSLLRQNRVSNTRRTLLAIAVYISILYITLGSAQASSDPPVHTPHTVANRILYYWMIPAVIFSAATRPFAHASSAECILTRLGQATNASGARITLKRRSLSNGGNSFWLPQKLWSQQYWIWAVAYISVGGAWMCSFSTSYFTPTVGLGCRSLNQLGFFLGWNITLAASVLLVRWKALRGPESLGRLFLIVYLMELFIAIPMVLVLLVGFQGTRTRYTEKLILIQS